MKKSRFTETQILKILKEAEVGVPVANLSREYGFGKSTFYKWKAKYGGLDASALRRMKELEEENRRLEDYRYTNEQIMMHQRLMVQIFTFSLIISVPLIGYGLQIFWGTKEVGEQISPYAPYIFLAPALLFIPALAMMYALREAIFQLITYSIVFHQQEAPGYDIRCRQATSESGILRKVFVVMVLIYWVLFLLCTALSVITIINQSWENIWGLALLLSLEFILISRLTYIYCSIDNKKNMTDRISRWEKVRKQEQPGIELPTSITKIFNWFRRILFFNRSVYPFPTFLKSRLKLLLRQLRLLNCVP